MGTPLFLSISDLYARVGAQKINSYFDDNANGTISDDTVAVNDVLCAAEGEYFSRMLRAYPGDYTDATSPIRTLIETDCALKQHVAWCAVEMASERRSEFTDNEGYGPYRLQYERAKTYIDNLSKGQIRSMGEINAGKGANTGGLIQPRPPTGTKEQFVFAPSNSSKAGHGGF